MLDAEFLRALDETVREIQGYSQEKLDYELNKSKDSVLALTIEHLRDFKRDYELSLYTDKLFLTKSNDVYEIIRHDSLLYDFSYLSFEDAINDEYYLMAA